MTHQNSPTTGYYVEVDIAGDPQSLREELNNSRPPISVVLLEAEGPAGCPVVRLRSNGRSVLTRWLETNGYELDVHLVIDARNPNAVPRRKK